ncbi:methyltransferase domain-containing protein [Vallitalea pronyensis]|uniref:Methyltransferase domain-containing protein n=1 Tax=Vallitalea pronyensis TaxID=1348613 RepID=A0A8J8SG25_9FIRM|nr:methyltransferase domain-containing protein [Vallitalea pronyensis]QUI21942.1 methyltransferase domain-containing protein [Vallitalea pronyensis]
MGILDDTEMVSRFFVNTDPCTRDFVFRLPADWWSRHYEYIWTSHFIQEDDICLDAACGVMHPLKFYLKDHCKATYACDLDNRLFNEAVLKSEINRYFGSSGLTLYEQKYRKGIHYSKQSIINLDYDDQTFDKVFCISVLEHLDPSDMALSLQSFKRVMKDDGLLVITLDYPTVNLNGFVGMLQAAGLKFAGDYDLTLPVDAIYTRILGGLYCFRAVLKKDL